MKEKQLTLAPAFMAAIFSGAAGRIGAVREVAVEQGRAEVAWNTLEIDADAGTVTMLNRSANPPLAVLVAPIGGSFYPCKNKLTLNFEHTMWYPITFSG